MTTRLERQVRSHAARYAVVVLLGQEAVVRLLVEGNDIEADSNDNYGWTPLLWVGVERLRGGDPAASRTRWREGRLEG